LVEEATIALRNFDTEFSADSAPFAAMLLRSESVASSNIENLSAGAKTIATAELGGKTGENARLIVSNVEAMQAAVRLSETIDETSILQMHETLLHPTQPTIVGSWRRGQVWVGGGRLSPHGANYVAPHHSRVPEAMSDLLAFANRDDISILVKIAVTHAQFENIHPFPDGNRRTGRALMSAMVKHEGLVDNVIVPISSGILANSNDYFSALAAYRSGDIDQIVTLTARSALFAVGNSRDLVSDIRALRAMWAGRVRGSQGSAARALTDMLAAQPVVTADTVARQLGVSPATAYRAIEEHVRAGVLERTGKILGVQAWVTPETIRALEAFATRAGRRT
jgi:Fic family protein